MSLIENMDNMFFGPRNRRNPRNQEDNQDRKGRRKKMNRKNRRNRCDRVDNRRSININNTNTNTNNNTNTATNTNTIRNSDDSNSNNANNNTNTNNQREDDGRRFRSTGAGVLFGIPVGTPVYIRIGTRAERRAVFQGLVNEIALFTLPSSQGIVRVPLSNVTSVRIA